MGIAYSQSYRYAPEQFFDTDNLNSTEDRLMPEGTCDGDGQGEVVVREVETPPDKPFSGGRKDNR